MMADLKWNPVAEGYSRKFFEGPDTTLSFIDFGGGGFPVLALHGHMNEGLFAQDLARTLAGEYRVIALDQRGHGESGRPLSYDNERYVDDALALLDHLGIDETVLLGHSLGGVVAYRLAARRPERVRALIIEDIGAVVNDNLSFTGRWPRRMPTKEALIAALGRVGPAFAYSMREYGDGWGLPFVPEDMAVSQRHLNGDHWDDWLATDCPALLLHGMRSTCLSYDQAEEMASRRPNTKLVHFEAGHSIHFDALDPFIEAIQAFLKSIRTEQ
ncbi:Pimeloyl-ACP methyl ester carboxylesterase [Paenibacillus sophorae]|uniref:Alpha/beta hydrolase n=1 Tax=Paenibacillus sophorae TaxID=1333845 RepID=A0A1H8I4X1_9BACL|nr:alpha/beta hydrolase [Paenibacillus sophorae]QWU15837.1 alpha/beta hydrolase [Paenibacillus sophorae]SEN62868.1 Pimeloyl-ACP methyl ester carboxylesterase [Paenibacillus sophorae]